MGDVGSLALGGALAAMAALLDSPLALIGLCLVPFLEAASVMIQVISFKTTGKRVFKMSPIHHHFELCGWSERRVVGPSGRCSCWRPSLVPGYTGDYEGLPGLRVHVIGLGSLGRAARWRECWPRGARRSRCRTASRRRRCAERSPRSRARAPRC